MDAITPLVKERPIIFNAPMVRAILEGRKTQTRRIVKSVNSNETVPSELEIYRENYPNGELGWFVNWKHEFGSRRGLICPYGKPGERLWVREAWAMQGSNLSYDHKPVYRADGAPWFGSWKPSIHMPRWASRILLEIASVRVERLHDISDADAIAEGVTDIQNDRGFETSFTYGFLMRWDKIHGRVSTDANPWVWVVEFKRVEA